MNLRAVLTTLFLIPTFACGGSELDLELDDAAALSDAGLWAIDPARSGPQCGLYRGGTIDAVHMIASPTPRWHAVRSVLASPTASRARTGPVTSAS